MTGNHLGDGSGITIFYGRGRSHREGKYDRGLRELRVGATPETQKARRRVPGSAGGARRRRPVAGRAWCAGHSKKQTAWRKSKILDPS